MSQIIEVVERYILPDFPDIDLPEEDGVPLESNWHRAQINLLIDIITYRWHDCNDFFAGGNMFIYYSLEQARNRDYRGPDFFLVKNIDSGHSRGKWVVWEEGGRYPNVIVELLSPSTAREDLGAKKELYERTFRTSDYFCYDPDKDRLWGWRLRENGYEALEPDEHGHLWSAQFEAWIGTWDGDYLKTDARWLRLFDENGSLIPTMAEAAQQQAEAAQQQAEAAQQQAITERHRAEAAEAELARLKEELARLKGQ